MTAVVAGLEPPLGGGARLALLVGVLAGIAVRVVALDRLPGINGDEAWYGVNAHELISGGTPFGRTPSGNIVNPFHSGIVLITSLAAEPSLVLLRVPSVLWGILTVLLTYPVLAGPAGRRAALYATLLVAASPALVAQARIGWDPSGTPFFSLLLIGFAMRDRPLLAALSGAAALMVHPTNVFAAPMGAAAWAPHAWRRYNEASPRRRRWILLVGAVVVAASVPVVLARARAWAQSGHLSSIEMVVDRIASPGSWTERGAGIVRLFSGVTSATYVAGPVPDALRVWTDVFMIGALVLPIALGWRAFRGGSASWGTWTLGGLIAGFVLFHVAAGSSALEPGFERYALCFIVPLSLLCAFGADALNRRWRHAGAVTATVTCTVLATILVVGYFRPLILRGGEAHQTFRTGLVEPKAAAFSFIRADSADAAVVSVFAENWWVYWPLRYLAHRERGRVHVEMLDAAEPRLRPAGVPPPLYPQTPGKVYVVVFDGGIERLRVPGRTVFTAVDPAGRPILHVRDVRPDAVPDFVGFTPWP